MSGFADGLGVIPYPKASGRDLPILFNTYFNTEYSLALPEIGDRG